MTPTAADVETAFNYLRENFDLGGCYDGYFNFGADEGLKEALKEFKNDKAFNLCCRLRGINVEEYINDFKVNFKECYPGETE